MPTIKNFDEDVLPIIIEFLTCQALFWVLWI